MTISIASHSCGNDAIHIENITLCSTRGGHTKESGSGRGDKVVKFGLESRGFESPFILT